MSCHLCVIVNCLGFFLRLRRAKLPQLLARLRLAGGFRTAANFGQIYGRKASHSISAMYLLVRRDVVIPLLE
jgi:hypothetical protein